MAYTRGNYPLPPAGDGDLDFPYTVDDNTKVAAYDYPTLDMVPQSATDEYAIHEFKVDATGKSTVDIEWVGQSNIDCSHSTVYLQIYDYTEVLGVDVGWTTIYSDTLTDAGTDISLVFSVPDLGPYKDANGIITCRVYQEAK